MRKMVLLLSRITLMLGVLVALMPCGICHASMDKASPACAMKAMSGKMDCCHKGKQASPFCKVMDQSSTAAVSHGLVAAPAPVVSFALPQACLSARVCYSVPAAVDTSPLRAPLALRI